MNEFIEKLNNYFTTDGVTLAKSVTLILLGYMAIKLVIKLLKISVSKTKLSEKTLANFLISLLNIVLMVVLVVYVLTLFGVSPDSVVTIASVFSLGVSLALQGTISSLANGVIIIVAKPFVEGDYIWVNGVEGTVSSISMFSINLITPLGQAINVPNSAATASNIINYSRLPTRRIDIVVPVGYDTEIEHVKNTILLVTKAHKSILKNPTPSCRLTKYGDSNLEFTLKAWCPTDVYWDTLFDLNEQILIALEKEKISIDYNQFDIHIKDFPKPKRARIEKGDK